MQKIISNKKALSQIITVVLITALSIVAISILFVFTKGLIKDIALSPEFSCFDINIDSPIKIQKTCYNQTTQDLEVTLKRKLHDTSITSLDFIMQNSVYSCGETDCNCIVLKQGETKTYFFSIEESPQQIIIKTQNCILDNKEVEVC